MKKFFVAFILIFLSCQASYSLDDVVALEFDENYQKHSINITPVQIELDEDGGVEDLKSDIDTEAEEAFEEVPKAPSFSWISEPVESNYFSLFNGIRKTADDIYKIKIANNDSPYPLLKDRTTKYFKKGPVESLHTWAAFQNNFDIMMPEEGNSYAKYDVNLINVLFDGKMKGGKDNFRLMINTSHQHQRPFMQNLVQDLFYETKRVPHHSILFGNSRVGIGLEGTQSPYTLPFLNRAQISRNFSNIRKVGVRVRGNYKYVDYDLGGYSSDTFFSQFMPGMEFNSWVNVKPLAKTKEKFGKLTAGSGISTGSRNSKDYFVYGAGLQYTYKKFWTRMEYAISDGSNGAVGLSTKRRHGWYVSLGYRLTKKTELVARYDEFNTDKSNPNVKNRREYTTGINYYVKGQSLKFVLNYIFCQNELNIDSHRILLGAQLAL